MVAAKTLLNTQSGLGVKLLPLGNRPAGIGAPTLVRTSWPSPGPFDWYCGTVGIPILQAGIRPSFKHRLKAGSFTACQGDFLV